MKKHMHAVGNEKRAIKAANKEQRRRRKANQREGQIIQGHWWLARPENHIKEDPRHQSRLQYQGD